MECDPCVGAAIASFGTQCLTTILTSFAVDSYKEQSATVGVVINVFRQVLGFVCLSAPSYLTWLFSLTL